MAAWKRDNPADEAGSVELGIRLLDGPGRGKRRGLIAVAMLGLRSRKALSRFEQADSAIDEFKQLLRRFIAVDLSGFYPYAADQEHPFQGSLNWLICNLFSG
jgi:hypothetical protein